MIIKFLAAGGLTALALCATLAPAVAQDEQPQATADAVVQGRYLEDTVSPFGPPPEEAGDPSELKMLVLEFTETPEIEADYDKYFYFVRSDVNHPTAYGDIVEYDSYARGLSGGVTYTTTYVPYGSMLGGAIGGAIGITMADAIYGTGERRRMRRLNIARVWGLRVMHTTDLAKPCGRSATSRRGSPRCKKSGAMAF